MSSKNPRKKNKKEQSPLRLKPLFGFIPPIIYTPVFFTAAGLWLLFGLFIAPGKKHYGSLMYINSRPQGALVYAGDKMLGSTPLEAFVPAGEYSLRLEKPCFEPRTLPVKVKGRLFFSLFFPKKQKLNIDLTVRDFHEWLAQTYYEASAWYSLPFNKVHGRSPIIRETADALMADWSKLRDRDKDSALQWILSLRDLIQDQKSWEEISAVWKAWDRSKLPLSDIPASYLKSDSFENFLETAKNTPAKNSPSVSTGRYSGPLRAGHLTFIPAEGGKIELGKAGEGLELTPTEVSVAPFYYMSGYLSAADFRRLTGENPADTEGPIVNINMEKAGKVIDAVNVVLKEQGISHLQADLPDEAQWQYLAETQRIRPVLFEWTSDNYIPYRFILHPGEAELPRPFEMRENAVRGESIFSGTLPLWHRFGYPGNLESPYISMRLVLEPKS